jgi:nucleotide-binding universal stress UspA family protein
MATADGVRPVIAGYDGRAHGLDALALGGAIAAARRAVMIAAHVSDPSRRFGEAERSGHRERMDQFRSIREGVASALTDAAGAVAVGVRSLPALNPARGLHDLAESERAATIVVGSSHHGPIGRVLVGSTGARLLVRAPCPIAVAPRDFRERTPRFERVAIAVDGCASCAAALREAAELSATLGAELSALTVIPHRDLPGAPERRTREALVDRVDAMLAESGAGELDRIVLEGRTVDQLARAAADFDLLVLGCRETGGPLGHPTVNSVSRDLMHRASSPVLVVPERAA